QSPSPPGPALSKKSKIVLGALFGLIAAGLGIAFAFELFLDPRVKRPSEIETRLHLPLFLSIPKVLRNGHVTLTLPAAAGQPDNRTTGPGDDSALRTSHSALGDGQRTEDGGQNSELGNQKSDSALHTSHSALGNGQRTEDGGQRTQDTGGPQDESAISNLQSQISDSAIRNPQSAI